MLFSWRKRILEGLNYVSTDEYSNQVDVFHNIVFDDLHSRAECAPIGLLVILIICYFKNGTGQLPWSLCVYTVTEGQLGSWCTLKGITFSPPPYYGSLV